LPILQKISDAYIIWHKNLGNLDRLARYTLGEKIDKLFTETIEYILLAGYSPREHKAAIVSKASTKLDSLKFFLQLMNRAKELPTKKYLEISQPLAETGKQLGGWQKDLQKK